MTEPLPLGDEPRIDPDVDLEDYHRDPALSASGAKLLIPPSTPAHYRVAMDDPRPSSRAMRLGTATHTKVLGKGQPWRVVVGDRRTKAVKAEVAAAVEAGFVVVTEDEGAYLAGASEAILAHPLARLLFEQPGRPEVSLWVTDPGTGVRTRCRPDYLPEPNANGLRVVPDLKSAHDASPERFGRNASDLMYHLQGVFYEEVIARATGDPVTFVMVAVEKSPPYLVAVHQLDGQASKVGEAWRQYALRLFARCTRTGQWPGYPVHVHPLSLPPWAPKPEDHEEP